MAIPRLWFAIFAICSISVVYSRSIDDCKRSSQEWCSNFTTAAECHAVKYCMENDWSAQSSDSVLFDDKCSTCVQQIENIRANVNSNITKEVIEDALDYICEMTIFTRVLRKQCENLIHIYVDSHINDLLDLINSDIDPKTICKVLDFCSTPPAEPESEDAAVYYDNIVLHIPASNVQIITRVEKRTKPVEHQLLGAKKCTWGPSYWCGNLTTSKECQSTSHCIDKYWSRTQYSEDNDSVCQVCKDMVKQARDQLLSNETQEELIEVLEGSCKLIPLKEIRQECIKLADEFVPELTEVLASQMNPTAVCTVAGLCNSARIDQMLAIDTPERAAATPNFSTVDSCVNCTVAFTAFERFMQTADKEKLLDKLLGACGALSSYSDLCATLIFTNLDDLYDLLKNQLPPAAACHLTGMCSYRYHAHIKIDDPDFQDQVDTMLAAPNDDLPCDLCKQLVHHFQEILTANTTEDEFHQMLLGMCQQTGRFRDECQKLVDDNFEVIYKFLTEELDPAKICIEIQICPRGPNYVSDAHMSLIGGLAMPAQKDETELPNLMSLSPLSVAASLSNADQHVDSLECKFCHTIVGVIQSELKNPDYENDVEKVIDKVCTLVPSSDEAKCEDFIDEYADTLIKTLADETDPFVVCRLLKICPTSPNPNDKTSGPLCPLCQYLLHFIQDSLDDPKDEAQIEDAVKKVCNIVPHAERNKCNQFIEQYSALIISILSQEVDPSLVCPALKLCPTSTSPKERCAHCRLFAADLIKRLDNNHELGNIRNKVSAVSPINGVEKSETVLLLRTSYPDELLDMMSAEFDADEACLYMRFCDKNTVSQPLPPSTPVEDAGGNVETNEIADSSPRYEGKPSCEVCELFVKIYEKELTSNKTEEELEDMLDTLCKRLHNPDMHGNCTKLVDKYVPLFLDLLKKNVSPRELCVAAKLCSLRTLLSNGDAEVECRTCEVAVGSLESVLGDPTIKEAVFERAVKVCDNMQGKSRSVCVTVITELLPQVEGIVFDVPAWFVCTKMKMCPYGDRMDASMSACSNPKLWCQDTRTAFMCDRLNYCRKNVWTSTVP